MCLGLMDSDLEEAIPEIDSALTLAYQDTENSANFSKVVVVKGQERGLPSNEVISSTLIPQINQV